MGKGGSPVSDGVHGNKRNGAGRRRQDVATWRRDGTSYLQINWETHVQCEVDPRIQTNDSERGRVLWRNDAKQMTRWAASSEGQPAGELMGGGRITAGRGGEASRSQKGEARLIN